MYNLLLCILGLVWGCVVNIYIPSRHNLSCVWSVGKQLVVLRRESSRGLSFLRSFQSTPYNICALVSALVTTAMARRRKTRTHVQQAPGTSGDVPTSFVIKHGQVGSSLTQLVRDIRKVMEPHTASRLRVSLKFSSQYPDRSFTAIIFRQVKERARNKLKDYLTLAPALQVTHLLAFTLTDIAPSFRIVRLPAGPTLSFRVERYSLVKDILKSSRRARSVGLEYLSPPLVGYPKNSPHKRDISYKILIVFDFLACSCFFSFSVAYDSAALVSRGESVPELVPASISCHHLSVICASSRSRVI
jgi:Brix domain